MSPTSWPLASWLDVRPRALGVLLPLTGSYGHVGNGALQALQLALEGLEGLTLVVRDTAGDARQAAAMARELVADGRVVAILGPVGRLETAESLAVTRPLGIPHVTLGSQLERVPSTVPGALDPAVRVRTSPEELARAVARHAVLEVGLKRLAVLAPEERAEGTSTPLGPAARQAAAFVEEVVRLGAAHARTSCYEPETKDFRLAAEGLLPVGVGGPGRRPKDVRPDFDGLFIPDTAARVRRIVPFLEFAGIMPRTRPSGAGVQLLGGAGWHHASVIDRGTGLTDNAIFADTWLSEAAADLRPDAFTRRFEAAAKQRPGPFHAEVHDAARLLGVAVAGASAGDVADVRGEVLRRLLTAGPQAGVTGILAFALGEPIPRARLLTVHGDTLRERVSEEEEATLRDAPPVGGGKN